MRILVNPEQLRHLAQILDGAGSDLGAAQGRLGGVLAALDWEARQRAGVDGQVGSARGRAQALAEQAAVLARYLRGRADAFQRADEQDSMFAGIIARAIQQIREGGWWRPSLVGIGRWLTLGSLFGAGVHAAYTTLLPRSGATLGIVSPSPAYGAMSWADRFSALADLESEIAKIKARTAGLTVEFLDGKISEVDAKIDEIEKKRTEAEEEAGKFWNKILPSKWPPEKGDDGHLWRTRADEQEDKIAEYDRQLDELKAEREGYLEQKEDLGRLIELTENRDALRKSMMVALNDGRQVQADQLDGHTPLEGMDSIYGKPGQYPLDAPITTAPGQRDPAATEAVIAQFGVETNPRYTPDKYHYCNTFTSDVMRAMGAPLPTKADLGVGGGGNISAGPRDLNNWLIGHGEDRGWHEVNPNTPEGLAELQRYANEGKPVVASDPGHIAVVRPGQNANSVKDLHIAQAGAHNTNDVALKNAGYGSAFKPRFFVHD